MFQGNGSHKIIGEVDILQLAKYIASLPKKKWDVNTTRQNETIHTDTKSIIIKFDDMICTGLMDDFLPYCSELFGVIKKFYGEFEIGRFLIVNLLAGGIIPEHDDGNIGTLMNHHRIHLPIVTNDSLFFIVDGERILQEVGVAVEINNQLKHSVINGGNDRIHLIIDIIEKSLQE